MRWRLAVACLAVLAGAVCGRSATSRQEREAPPDAGVEEQDVAAAPDAAVEDTGGPAPTDAGGEPDVPEEDAGPEGPADTGTDTGADTDTGTDTDADAGTDAGTDADTGSDTDTGTDTGSGTGRCPWPAGEDPDGDGLESCVEHELLLHPELPDTDGNGLDDGVVVIGERLRLRGPFAAPPAVTLGAAELAPAMDADGAALTVVVPEGTPAGPAALAVDGALLAGVTVVRLALVGGAGDELRRLDVGGPAEVGRGLQLPGPPGGLVLLPGGAEALVSLPDAGAVVPVDLVAWRVLGEPLPVGDVPRALAVLPGGTAAVVACYFGRTLRRVELGPEGPAAGPEIDLEGMPSDLTRLPEGLAVALVDRDTVAVLHPDEGGDLELTVTLPVAPGPEAVRYDPLGDRLLVASGLSNAVTALLRPDWEARDTPLPGSPIHLDLSPLSALALVGTLEGEVVPVDLTGGRFEVGEPLALGAQPGVPVFLDGGAEVVVPLSITVDEPPARDRRLARLRMVEGTLVDTGERTVTLEAPWLLGVQP